MIKENAVHSEKVKAGKEIKNLRIAKGWTFYRLSVVSGVAIPVIHSIENASANYTIESLFRLKMALNDDSVNS